MIQQQTNGKRKPSRDRNMTPPTSLLLAGQDYNEWPGELHIYEAPWALVSYHIPDDEDRDGTRNIGFFYTSDAADCPRRFY
jgi:hypothetical protein